MNINTSSNHVIQLQFIMEVFDRDESGTLSLDEFTKGMQMFMDKH